MDWQFNLLKQLSLSHEAIRKGVSNMPIVASIDIKKSHLNFSIGYKIPFPFVKRIIPGDGASRELKSILKLIENKLGLNNKLY